MLALGITGGFKGEDESDPAGYARHDAAAVLLEDSRLVCAIEEERRSGTRLSPAWKV